MSDYRTTKGEAPPATRREQTRTRAIVILVLLCILSGVGLTGTMVQVRRYVEAAGYVTTEHYAEVRPTALGTVAEILVESGAQVERGGLLVRLDAAAEQATLEEAKSRVSKVEAELARRRAEIQERKRKLTEDIAISKLRLQNTTTKFLRTQELLGKGLVAGSALEDDKLKEELAKAELTSLMSKDQSLYDKELAVLERDVEGCREGIARAEARDPLAA